MRFKTFNQFTFVYLRFVSSVVEKVKRAYVPLVWFEVAVDLTDDLGWWVNLALDVPVIGTASFFALFCISVLTVTVSGVVLLKRRSRSHPIASASASPSSLDAPVDKDDVAIDTTRDLFHSPKTNSDAI